MIRALNVTRSGREWIALYAYAEYCMRTCKSLALLARERTVPTGKREREKIENVVKY